MKTQSSNFTNLHGWNGRALNIMKTQSSNFTNLHGWNGRAFCEHSESSPESRTESSSQI
jgi:hypothetical protein